MAKRIALGLCPKCETAVDPEPTTVCRCCGLQIGGVSQPPSCTPLLEQPVVVRMKPVWRQ
jgi:predicted amidophosphoribosyltransferase